MRILLLGGGSGGHVMPIIAVERALRTILPQADLRIICSDRPSDGTMLERAGLPHGTLPLLCRSIGLPLRLLRSIRSSRRILREYHPDVIFSKGASMGIPLCMLAARRGIPVILHESDVVMGRANRFLQKYAAAICLGFPMTTTPPNIQPSTFNIHHTGNPVRPDVMKGSRAEGLRLTGFSGKRPILLVLGGSQGSVALNEAVRKNLEALIELCDIIHLTGEGKVGAHKRPGYWSAPFAYAELADLYACATLALSRAGAGTIAELAAHRLPMILVPLRGVAQDHQQRNALAIEQNGGCVLLQQEVLPDVLVQTVRDLCVSPKKCSDLADSATKFAPPDAARLIAEIIAKQLAH